MAVRQLDKHELWKWMDEFHWKHWHGIWVRWEPFKSPEVSKSYRSVRSMQPANEDRSILRHQNQWYNPRGAGEAGKWMFGPWIISRDEHCIDSGIIHPNVSIARTLPFPNGDLSWIQIQLTPGEPNLVASEAFFMLPGNNQRMAVIFRFSGDGELGASLIAEEVRGSDERPGEDWSGELWSHEVVRSDLEPSRAEPEGKFIGTEMELTTKLQLTTRENVIWEGFKHGLEKQEEDDYALICLPYGFTGCVSKNPVDKSQGGELAFAVSWVVSSEQVRCMYWRYSSQGELLYLRTARYHRENQTDASGKGITLSS